MAEKLEFDLSVKNNQLSKTLDEASKKSSELEEILKTAVGVFGGSLITKGFDAIVSGFNSIVEIGKESIAASAESEVAINNLTSALSRTGRLSKETRNEFIEFASAMEKTTTLTDEAVLGSVSLLASLTKLSNEGLREAAKASADLAVVLGIDLDSATRIVAKAAEGNITVLKRYGIEAKKGASDSETFKNTLDALNSKFSGAATAQLNTYAGAVKSLGISYDQIKEPIGDIITQNPLVIAGLNEFKAAITSLGSDISGGKSELQLFVNDGLFYASSATQVLLDALDGITVVTKAVVNSFQFVGGVILTGLVEPIKLLIDGFIFLGSKIPGIGDQFEGLENPLNSASQAIKDFTNDGLKGFEDSADTNIFRKLSDGVATYTDAVISSSAQVAIAQEKAKETNTGRLNSEEEIDVSILNKRKDLLVDIKALQEQFSIEEQTNAENKLAILETNDTVRKELEIQNELAHQARLLEVATNAELEKTKSILDPIEKRRTQQKIVDDAKLKAIKLQNKAEEDLGKLSQETQKKDKEAFFAAATSLQSSKNKELAAVGKAFAIQQAVMQGYQSVQSSFNFGTATGGPILGAVFAAIAATASAANVAKIAGVAFEQGGFVGGLNGASVGADNRVAQVRDGEMILNASQQKNLLDMINGGGGSSSPIIIQIDGREIAVAVRNQIQGGFRLA